MEIVRYQQFYEFHFAARLQPGNLARLLNSLSIGFHFEPGPGDIYVDRERGPGVFSLHLKQYPPEEKTVPKSQANYLIRWAVQFSDGGTPQIATALARQLSMELETQVWLLDGYGRPLRVPSTNEELSA